MRTNTTPARRSRTATLVRALAVLMPGVGLACDSPTMGVPAPGYDPTSITQFIYGWGAGTEIKIYVDTNNEPEGADLEAAVRAGIAAWERVGLLGEVRMRMVRKYTDADVIFHHSSAPRLVASELCDPFDIGAGGYTFFCVDDNNNVIPLYFADGSPGFAKMDVAINIGALDTASFFPALVVHELGHVLGIGAHSLATTDLMHGRPRKFAPTASDAATLRYVLSRRPEVQF